MGPDILTGRDFTPEFTFTASRSSGPGGQNVNKVSTKVELRFNINNSSILTQEEKNLLLEKLAGRITKEGELVVVSQSERSQLKNKEAATTRFYALITKALTPRKKRKPTHPTAASDEKRLEEKKMRSEKKEQRKRVG
jgi:ribosome-associated protein